MQYAGVSCAENRFLLQTQVWLLRWRRIRGFSENVKVEAEDSVRFIPIALVAKCWVLCGGASSIVHCGPVHTQHGSNHLIVGSAFNTAQWFQRCQCSC